MAKSDQGDGEGFSARWARRKRETRTGEPAEPRERAVEPSPGDSDVPELPDPDTLDAEADFTIFLKDNVPEALRRRALRRLWRLNPVFANLDGLNDYDEDYTDAATVVEGLKTLYKVGKGFVDDEDEKPEEAAQSEAEAAVETAEVDEGGSELPAEAATEPAQGAAPAPVPAAKDVKEIALSGPGNRRRGAAARRWGGGGS